MKLWSILFAVFGLLVLTSCARAPQFAPSQLAPSEWQLDPTHASIIFRVDHAGGLSRFTGRFDRFDAALFFDAAQPTNSKVSVHIEAHSINTGVPVLDKKLVEHNRALAAKEYPIIRFESEGISNIDGHTAMVNGTLTLRGVTLPITLHTKWNGTSFDPLRRAQVLGFSAQTEFDRTLFGADAWKNFGVGTKIDVQIEVEFLKRTSQKED
ncbi:MAG: YceI family protein [Robiginitomaculum sp.]|nr:YceI family protein [Robiginitomaculum sp.]